MSIFLTVERQVLKYLVPEWWCQRLPQRVLQLVLFTGALAWGVSASAQIKCSQTFEPRIPVKIPAKFQFTFAQWINGRIDGDKDNNKFYTQEQFGLTRWQFLQGHMTPHFRELLKAARPEFFHDQILPDPLQLTQGLKRVYLKKRIPKEQWVLPGLALVHKKTKKVIYRSYEELIPWPPGYEVAGSQLPGTIFNRGILHGILHIQWGTDINPQFNVHGHFHDLNHLAAMTNHTYLKMIRKYSSDAYRVIDESSDPIAVADVYFGPRVGYEFFEDFWVLPRSKVPQLNQFLSQFRNPDGQVLDNSFQPRRLEEFDQYLISPRLLNYWRQLVSDGLEVNRKIEAYRQKQGYKNDLPTELVEERNRILRGYQPILTTFEPILKQIKEFHEKSVVQLGGAIGDQFSTRSWRYARDFESDPGRWLRFIENGFHQNLTRLSYYKPEDFSNSLAHLLQQLISRSQLEPEAYIENLLEKAR